MNLTITLPDAVHSLLAAHPKGAEAATLVAIKRYLKATATEGRDQSIADEAVLGATYAELANKYAMSISRVQQLVALGRDAALLRNPIAHTTTTTPTVAAVKPKRVLTQTDIDNLHRMRSESATNAEMMQAFAITIEEVQAALRTAPTPKPAHTTTTPKPAHTTLHGIPLPSHDFEFDLPF